MPKHQPDLPLGLPWWVSVAIVIAWLIAVGLLAYLVRRALRRRAVRRRRPAATGRAIEAAPGATPDARSR